MPETGVPRRQYTEEFKSEAVKLAETRATRSGPAAGRAGGNAGKLEPRAAPCADGKCIGSRSSNQRSSKTRGKRPRGRGPFWIDSSLSLVNQGNSIMGALSRHKS